MCGFRSSFHSQVSSHFEQCHSGTGLLLCLYCLRVLSSSSCYQQHVARHQVGPRPLTWISPGPPPHLLSTPSLDLPSQRKHVFSCSKCRLHFLFVRERVEHQRLHHGTHVRPPQLSRLKPGTKVGPLNNLIPPGLPVPPGTHSAQTLPTQLPLLCLPAGDGEDLLGSLRGRPQEEPEEARAMQGE